MIQPPVVPYLKSPALVFFFFLRFYLFIHERHRKAETQAEGEAGSLQGARCSTQSQDPGIMTQSKAEVQPLSHPDAPEPPFYMVYVLYG